MKKLLFMLLLSAAAFGQIKFEKGYFIDNQNVRTECLIKNVDWNDTPVAFNYKISETDIVASKTVAEIKEFGVGDAKFISREVDIDQSEDRPQHLSGQKNPEFVKSRVFLKLLADGKAKLYSFKSNDRQRFFYSVNDGAITALVYKRYFSDHAREEMATNNTFRQQLWSYVKCENMQMADVQKLSYMRADLTDYFDRVNSCNGSSVAQTKTKTKKGSFNLKGSLLLGAHSLSVDGPLASQDFGNKTYIGVGIEAEFILPFWNNKWGMIIEPTFNSYKNSDSAEDDGLAVEFRYIEVMAGVRHYFFLNDKTKLFLNVGLSYAEISNSSAINFEAPNPNYEPYLFSDNSVTLFAGLGLSYRKFSGELRMHSKNNPTPYGIISYGYTNTAFVLRYQFL